MPIVFEEVQAEIDDAPTQEGNAANDEPSSKEKLNEFQVRKMLTKIEKQMCRTFAD